MRAVRRADRRLGTLGCPLLLYAVPGRCAPCPPDIAYRADFTLGVGAGFWQAADPHGWFSRFVHGRFDVGAVRGGGQV